jgi:hypothetical protein
MKTIFLNLMICDVSVASYMLEVFILMLLHKDYNPEQLY